jgi:sugar phosphate isomerase/epimerase
MSNNFNNKELEEELNWAIRCIKFAEELEIEVVRIDAIMENEKNLPLEEAKKKAIECLRYILEKTKDTKVELGIENHGVHGNNPDFISGILKEINSQRLGVTLDTGNFYWSGKPLEIVYEILKTLAPWTKHTHLKNIKYPEDLKNKQREIGWEYEKYVCPIFEGDIDHRKVINFLKEASYKRDLTIEDESLGKFKTQKERKEILRKDVDYLKNIL